ncbi:MAG: hypothetical protein HQL58_12130 [Magnetococcales bacterium]|nr:hypothetical protein [Magnetococcales bacterium]
MANDPDLVRQLVADGYCPVECSFGAESIVDDLVMDHHGCYGQLESVALRAYRDHAGARSDDPRFVVAGHADADATFAVAALMGLLPQGLLPLAQTVARMDSDPIGVDPATLPMGSLWLLWHLLRGPARDDMGLATGVGLWRSLTSIDPVLLQPLLDAAVEVAQQRQQRQLDDLARNGQSLAAGVGFISTADSSGFNVWYQRQPDHSADSLAGWRHPLVVHHHPHHGTVTLGCPNAAVARELLGPGGLHNLFPLLGPGWGGRDCVGGSPRQDRLSAAEAREVAEKVVAVAVLRQALQDGESKTTF